MRVELLIFVYSATTIFAASACLIALGCALWGPPTPLLPPRRTRFISWGGMEVLVAFSAVVLLMPLVFELTLQSSGFFRWLYDLTGGDFEAQFGSDQDKEFRHLAIWETFLGFPFKLILLLVLLYSCGSFRPYQLGFTRHRLWQMLGLGWLVWLVGGLPCDLFHFLLSHAYSALFPHEQDIHAIIKIAQEHPPAVEWFLLVSSAVFIAPFLEEVLFRGLLLRWLVHRPNGVIITLGITFTLAALTRASRAETALRERNWISLADAFAPFLFASLVAVTIQALTSFKLNRRTCTEWQAILASSLFFAIAHANVWPSPLALFVFAIGLGWVACRTQSIVPCIVAHSLFNAVACVELGMGLVREYLPFCSG